MQKYHALTSYPAADSPPAAWPPHNLSSTTTPFQCVKLPPPPPHVHGSSHTVRCQSCLLPHLFRPPPPATIRLVPPYPLRTVTRDH
eukprot:768367-Hanusia_phi.AAC.7